MMVSDARLNEYADNVLKQYEDDSLASQDIDLVRKIRTYLRQGLIRLNAVPENDPFWANSNRNPTLSKLGDYLKRHNQHYRPIDGESEWIEVAYALHYCSNDFGRRHLEHLVELDVENIQWLIAAARWVWELTGYDTTDFLKQSLEGLREKLQDFDNKLTILRESGSYRIRIAAIQAIDILNGKRLSA
jgi:hypothetical protein